MKKNLIKVICLFVIISVTGGYIIINTQKDINKILDSEDYSFLPVEAKQYVKEVYEETGELILTEKNKEENKLYLNPQYVEYLSSSEEEKTNFGDIPMTMIVDYYQSNTYGNNNIPNSYDLRNVNGNNYVTPVRDQGKLGICWTFATAGMAESHILKTTNSSYSASSKLISERQIDYATSRNGIKDYKSEYISFITRSLGDGGNVYISTILLANGVSLIDYSSFKEYNDTDMEKMELSDVLSYSNSLYEVNSTINIPYFNLRASTKILTDEQNETRNSYLNSVKQNIMENGAAYVSTRMDSSCRYEDSKLGNTVIDVYNCSYSGGHAMEIIGWNDDIEYSYCADTKVHNSNTSKCNRVVSGKGVWILKNSWGDSIQYPYLTYDSLYTNISFIDEIESSQNKNWDNNYILGNGTENVKNKTYMLSDTKIKNDEKIIKVKFITETSNTKYNVKIKKKDGTYSTFSKTNNLPGLITIDITENIIIDDNTEITVYSDNGFIDKFMIFTTNVDSTPFIDFSGEDNKQITDDIIRLYSNTKNIPSTSTIDYKLYDSKGQDISNKVIITNNIVVENNINTSMSIIDALEDGTYRIDAIYNSNVIGSMHFNIISIQGTGTIDDPYIITNSTQLYQIRNNLNAYYELGNDIDLTVDTHEGGKYSTASINCPQGFGWAAINDFSGSLDGKGHTIKGLYQNNYITCNEELEKWTEWNNEGNGLFGRVKGNATIKNLILEDFDINCQGGYCGALVSKYIGNMNEYGKPNWSDSTQYIATFENIAIKNSKITGAYNRYHSDNSLDNPTGGGLFGLLQSLSGTITISNIYIDINLNPTDFKSDGLLANYISGNIVNVKNIRLLSNFQGREPGDKDIIFVDHINGSIKNVLSTITATKVKSSLIGLASSDIAIDSINLLNVDNKSLCSNNCSNAINVNLYDKDTQIIEFTKRDNYNSWEEFDNNWIIKTIDGIPRIPVLKFMDFEYTKISNISLNQVLNEKVSIYDYITPNIASAKNIIAKSNNEEIVTIGDDGLLIPKSTGNTTIHVESLYDGYIKDVPISVNYVPHYTVKFDANGGTGTMEPIEVAVGNAFKIPENEFTKDYYELKEWNTEADGTGTSYIDLGEIHSMNDKDTITLYAIWWGEERIVTFNANGGTVSPDKKMVREIYGDLPIPIREGYGFHSWASLTDSININVNAFAQFQSNELAAQWVEDAYTIVYDANGGTIREEYKHKSTPYVHSETIVTSYAKNNQDTTPGENSKDFFEREGYIFKEWNTEADGTGTSYNVSQTINRSSNITLYAIWEEKYAYEFTIDGDTIFSDVITIDLKLNKKKDVDLTKLTGSLSYDKTRLSLKSSKTIDGYNLSYDEDTMTFTITGSSINDGENIISLTFEKNNMENEESTNISINNLIANEDEYLIKEKNLSKKIIYNENGYIKGDINQSGNIDLIDVIHFLKIYLAIETTTNKDLIIGDMNNDGSIGLIDIIDLLKLYLGIS